MKHSYKPADIKRLNDWLLEGDAVVDAGALAVCVQHLEWVLEQNVRLNLTAPVSPAHALRVHLLDSLLAVDLVRAAAHGDLVDIGTGGGFPGLPLAIASSRRGMLVDSVKKKAHAVEGFLDRDGVSDAISVHGGRSEELASTRPASFSVAVARAVAPLPTLVELASPLLQDGGVLIALKARPDEEEIQLGNVVAAKTGMGDAEISVKTLPGGDELRTFAVYRKISESAVRLPRRPGMASKRPLYSQT